MEKVWEPIDAFEVARLARRGGAAAVESYLEERTPPKEMGVYEPPRAKEMLQKSSNDPEAAARRRERAGVWAELEAREAWVKQELRAVDDEIGGAVRRVKSLGGAQRVKVKGLDAALEWQRALRAYLAGDMAAVKSYCAQRAALK